MNDCILLLDGIGDYSVIHKINRMKIPDIYFPTLAKFLKDIGFKTKYIDARTNTFTKEQLYNSIETLKPRSIVIKTSFDNIKQIGRLKLKEIFNHIQVILFSENFDPDWLSYVGAIRMDHLITIDKTIHLNQFINQILQVIFLENNSFEEIKKISDLSVEKLVSDWTFIENITDYIPELNISSGCGRKCSFCSIANSNVEFRDVDLVMDEIEYLLDNGVQYFHIANHSFSTDLSYMEKFCKKIISKFKNRDFVWSCFGIPEYLLTDTKIFKLLKESKLGRIEFSIESESEDMLRRYNINSNKKIMTEVIGKAVESDIISILGHLIIGGPFESKQTIHKTLNFVKQLIQIAPGSIEFNISFFHPDVNSKIYRNLENYEIKFNNQFNEKGIRKIHCMCETNHLPSSELTEVKKRFNNEIIPLLKASVHRLDQKKRLTHIDYYKKGLCTQYYFNFLSRSSTFGLYQLKYKNRFLKFTWEIENEIDNYSPYLLGKMIKHDGKDILVFDPLLSDGYKSPFLEVTGDEYIMVQLADGTRTLKEIVDHFSHITNHYQNVKKHLLSFYRKLESLDLMLFAKLLR